MQPLSLLPAACGGDFESLINEPAKPSGMDIPGQCRFFATRNSRAETFFEHRMMKSLCSAGL
ncbi:MAG: hypothetical protein DRH32_04705 [Deltaproteobacteria bacterium]|nr:MAG: hypothetical protein DRH32_04705 [Deltaproteobacteria bacterium]